MKKLESRARKLSKKNFDKVAKKEAKLDKIIRKEKKYNRIRTPNTFYCTFEHSKAAQALLEMKKLPWKDKIFSKLSKPNDPTDIRWTNRSISGKTRKWISILIVLYLCSYCYAMMMVFLAYFDK